jgi:DNA-directed RNA polymerase subunit RPC12/RpoP
MPPFIARQEPFVCEHCHEEVEPLENGSYRNHCPTCLWSKHVDKDGPGDRLSECKGLMEPTGLDHDGKKGWMIVHRCIKCGKTIPNRAAPDDDITLLRSRN